MPEKFCNTNIYKHCMERHLIYVLIKHYTCIKYLHHASLKFWWFNKNHVWPWDSGILWSNPRITLIRKPRTSAAAVNCVKMISAQPHETIPCSGQGSADSADPKISLKIRVLVHWIPYALEQPFCKWFWSGFWVPKKKYLLTRCLDALGNRFTRKRWATLMILDI